MTLRSKAIALVMLALAGHSSGQETAAGSLNTCEIRLPDAAADRAEAAQRRKLAAQRRQYESLKAKAEPLLADLPPSKRRDDLEQTFRELARRFDEIERRVGLPPLCSIEKPPSKAYVQEVVRRIEECGTRNFPKAQGRSLYGSASLAFVLDVRGEIDSVEIRSESGSPEIDQHSLRLVRASAPFGPVPQALHQDRFGRFLIHTSFNFSRDQNPRKPRDPRMRCTFE